MKKFLFIIAACAMFTACNSLEREAIERLEAIQKAWDNNDTELAMQLTEDIAEWESSLSDEEKAEVGEAVKKWAESNVKDI